jgi:hypothetical protein
MLSSLARVNAIRPPPGTLTALRRADTHTLSLRCCAESTLPAIPQPTSCTSYLISRWSSCTSRRKVRTKHDWMVAGDTTK